MGTSVVLVVLTCDLALPTYGIRQLPIPPNDRQLGGVGPGERAKIEGTRPGVYIHRLLSRSGRFFRCVKHVGSTGRLQLLFIDSYDRSYSALFLVCATSLTLFHAIEDD